MGVINNFTYEKLLEAIDLFRRLPSERDSENKLTELLSYLKILDATGFYKAHADFLMGCLQIAKGETLTKVPKKIRTMQESERALTHMRKAVEYSKMALVYLRSAQEYFRGAGEQETSALPHENLPSASLILKTCETAISDLEQAIAVSIPL